MLAYILYRADDYSRNSKFADMFIDEGSRLGVDIKVLLLEKLSFGTESGRLSFSYENKEAPHPDFIISRYASPLLSKYFEKMGIRVFNSSYVSEICNSKINTHIFFANSGIEMADTVFYKSGIVPDFSNINYPVVIKPSSGHGGMHVVLANNDDDIKNAVKLIYPDDFLIQKLVSDLGKDLRVYVLGNKILCPVLRTSCKDFRSNYSLGGKASVYNLSASETALVEKVIKLFPSDFIGIDFIFDNGRMLLNEIEDVVGTRMLYELTDINVVKLYLEHIISSIQK